MESRLCFGLFVESLGVFSDDVDRERSVRMESFIEKPTGGAMIEVAARPMQGVDILPYSMS